MTPCTVAWMNVAVMLSANVFQHSRWLPGPEDFSQQEVSSSAVLANEQCLTRDLGRFCFLSAQTLALLLVYHLCTAIAETMKLRSSSKEGRWGQRVDAMAPVAVGIGSVVFALYVASVGLMRIDPTSRDQWTFYEAHGYPYGVVMHLLHAPLLLCPLVDVAFRHPLKSIPLSMEATLGCVLGYISFYGTLTTVNSHHSGCFVYPFLADLGSNVTNHILFYALVSIPVSATVLAVRHSLFFRRHHPVVSRHQKVGPA